MLTRVVKRIPTRFRFAFDVAVVDDERRAPFSSDGVEHMPERSFAGGLVYYIRRDRECEWCEGCERRRFGLRAGRSSDQQEEGAQASNDDAGAHHAARARRAGA